MSLEGDELNEARNPKIVEKIVYVTTPVNRRSTPEEIAAYFGNPLPYTSSFAELKEIIENCCLEKGFHTACSTTRFEEKRTKKEINVDNYRMVSRGYFYCRRKKNSCSFKVRFTWNASRKRYEVAEIRTEHNHQLHCGNFVKYEHQLTETEVEVIKNTATSMLHCNMPGLKQILQEKFPSRKYASALMHRQLLKARDDNSASNSVLQRAADIVNDTSPVSEFDMSPEPSLNKGPNLPSIFQVERSSVVPSPKKRKIESKDLELDVNSLPRVSATLDQDTLKEECKARGMKNYDELGVEDLLKKLGNNSICMHQTDVFRAMNKLRELMKTEEKSKVLVESQKNLHTEYLPGLHRCLLAFSKEIMLIDGRRRPEASNCSLNTIMCKQLPYLSCERCNFDVCKDCMDFELLPADQRRQREKRLSTNQQL